MNEDIETRVLDQFKRRLRDSPEIGTATQTVLIEDLDSMDKDRSELLDQLVEERS